MALMNKNAAATSEIIQQNTKDLARMIELVTLLTNNATANASKNHKAMEVEVNETEERKRKGPRESSLFSSQLEKDVNEEPKREAKRQESSQKSSTAKPVKTTETTDILPTDQSNAKQPEEQKPKEAPKETQKDAPKKVLVPALILESDIHRKTLHA